MVSMVQAVTLADDADVKELRDALMQDERWNIAVGLGARELRILSNSNDPTEGIIETRWSDLEGAKRFADLGGVVPVEKLRLSGGPKIFSAGG